MVVARKEFLLCLNLNVFIRYLYFYYIFYNKIDKFYTNVKNFYKFFKKIQKKSKDFIKLLV